MSICQSSTEEIDSQIFKKIGEHSSQKNNNGDTYSDGEYDTVEGRVALLAEIPSSSESSKQRLDTTHSNPSWRHGQSHQTANFEGCNQAAYNSMPQLPLVAYSATEHSGGGYEFLEKIREENETEKWTCSNEMSGSLDGTTQHLKGRDSIDQTLANTKKELDLLNNQIQRNIDDNHASQQMLEAIQQEKLELKDEPIRYSELQAISKHRQQSELIQPSVVSPGKNALFNGSQLMSFALSNSQPGSQPDTDLFASQMKWKEEFNDGLPQTPERQGDGSDQTPPRDYLNTLRQYQIDQSDQALNRQSDISHSANSFKPSAANTNYELTEDNWYDNQATGGECQQQQLQAHLFENENCSPNKMNIHEFLNLQNYQSAVSFQNQMKLNSPDFSKVLSQREKAKMVQPPAKSVLVRSPRKSDVPHDGADGKSLGYETSSRDFLNADLNLVSFHNYVEMNDYEGDIKEDSMKILKVQRKKVSDNGKSRNNDSNHGECGGSNSIGIFNPRFVDSEITRSMASAQTNQEQQEHESLSLLNRSKKQFHETTVLKGVENIGHQSHPIKIVQNEALRPETDLSSSNSPNGALQSEKTKIFYIIERIRQTQQLFMHHKCTDLLMGKDQSSWINIDDYVENNNKTLLDLLGQIMDQHDSLSVNVIHFLAQIHLKETQMEQLEINLEHARASGEAQLKETFQSTITAIKENFENEVNDFRKQTLTESSKQQVKNNQLIQEQIIYQQSLQKCKEIIQVQQEQKEKTASQIEMQYKDLIQIQQDKMERMHMQNERMHETISKLKDDLSRYVEKDELVSKTFNLNATQLVNMEKTIQQQTKELNRLQKENEAQKATITDLKEQNDNLNNEVGQREDIESQNQLLRYLEGLMLDNTINAPNNTVKFTNVQENSKYNTGSKLQMNEMMMNIDRNGMLIQDGHENILMGVPPSLLQTYDQKNLKIAQNTEVDGLISAEFNLSRAYKNNTIPEGLIADFAEQQILTEPSLVNTRASEGLKRMMEKSTSRNELQNQRDNGANAEFKEDTFGESTLNVNQDTREEGGSMLKNSQKLLMRTNQYPITSNITKIELNFLASAKNIDQNKLIEREIFENLSIRKSASSSNRQNSTKRSKSSNTSRGNYQSREFPKTGKSKLQYHTSSSSVDISNPFQNTDTNQTHCDLVARHISILGQNEQIIKQFKQREKEMIDTYDKIVADQDTKLQFLDLQKEEALLTHSEKIKELQAIISGEALKEADLQKNLETERDTFEQTAEGLRNTIKQNVEQIHSLKESIVKLEEDTKKEKEELQLTLKQQHETELNIIKNSHQDELEKAWRDLEVKDEVINQNYKTIDEFSQQIKEYHETILKLTEQKNAIHNVNLELMDEYEELVLRNDKVKIEKEQLLNEKEQTLKDQQVLLNEQKALEDQNKTLAESNDVFQSTIIDELNKLNESITMKKNKKNKEKQQQTLRNLLGNFQQSMGLTTDDTTLLSKSRHSKSRSPTGNRHNQSKSRSPSNHYQQHQLNHQLQYQQLEPQGHFSKTMTTTPLDGQQFLPMLNENSFNLINQPISPHHLRQQQPFHLNQTFEGTGNPNTYAPHYHLQTQANPISQDTTLNHCKTNLNDSQLTDQHWPNNNQASFMHRQFAQHSKQQNIMYESSYGQKKMQEQQYMQECQYQQMGNDGIVMNGGQEGGACGFMAYGEVGEAERYGLHERNLTGILATYDDRGLQSTRSGNHQRHNTVNQFQNMNLQNVNPQQQHPQQANLKSKFAQNFQQTYPRPIRVVKSHSPVRPDHSSAKRTLNEVNHQCNVMDLIIDSISQTTRPVNQQHPQSYQAMSPATGTRAQATPEALPQTRAGSKMGQHQQSNSIHQQPLAQHHSHNNDQIISQATTGQQSAHRRTKSRRNRLSTSREKNLDTSGQHTARMVYSGERHFVQNQAGPKTESLNNDSMQFATREKQQNGPPCQPHTDTQAAPLVALGQSSSRDIMLNVGSSSAKSFPNGGGLSHRGSQYNFKSLKFNS